MADNTSRKMARIAYDALMDKKAQDVRVINIENVSSIADFFPDRVWNEPYTGRDSC